MKILNIVSQFREGLYKSRKDITDKLELLFNYTARKLEFLEKFEELLILSDVGVSATNEIMSKFNEMDFKEYRENNFTVFKEKLKIVLLEILNPNNNKIDISKNRINVVMLVGVNGSGKTSMAGKIAYRLKNECNNILLVPADTFRAAGIQQLKILADQVGVEMVNSKEGADPASVVFDGLNAAKARRKDVVIIDTAGRLHTKTTLMNELEKIKRIIQQKVEDCSFEILQVIDATTGQNAIVQAKIFNESLGVTGIALTKMDGTAKGGIIIAIKKELDIPVKLISFGEKLNNLYDFDANKFIDALLD